jgi:hypothetical protein
VILTGADRFNFQHRFIDRQLPGNSWAQTALADMDKDGRLDYITGQTRGPIFWYHQEALDRWERHTLGTNSPSDVGGAALDVDGDGWIDFVAGGAWYRNSGPPHTEPFERIVFDRDLAAVHDLVVADIDRDGRADILTMSDRNNLRCYRIPRDPRQAWERHDIGPGVHAGIGVGDIDGDGDLDVARSNLWFDNADGKGTRWVTRENIPFGNPNQPYPLSTHCVALDLDRDGDCDLVMTENEIKAGRIGWLENRDGKGGAWKLHELATGDRVARGAYHSLIVADFDNDGDSDIFSCEMEGIPGDKPPRWFIWENADSKGGQFVEHVILDANLGGHLVVAGDVDGDGDLDLVGKLWRPRKDNANGGRNHVDLLENRLVAKAASPPPSAVSASPSASAATEKSRLFVLTDIANEPDDEESLVRLLVYANQFDLEGLVATTSTWLRHTTRVDLIRRDLAAYAQVRDNLLKHATGFPTREQLEAVTAVGQTAYGMAAVGEGKSTAGSRLLLAAAGKADERPLWVSVWGGANTLAQALFDARNERSLDALKQVVAKLRVYTISDQDDAGPWLRREFPGLFYIVSPSTTDSKEYWRATWTGISGDRHYKNGPGHKFHLVDNPWLEENIIKNHGALGALYPNLAYIMEGDTPSFLGLINNGLGWRLSPAYGGWGGRYALYQHYGETRPIWTNSQESRDTVTADNGQTECTDMATIWRWREHFQHDFAARMDWCVTDDFKQANHNPVAVLNGDTTKRVLELSANPGETVKLSAEGTRDPDGHAFEAHWWIYPEASTLRNAKGRRFPHDLTLSASRGLQTSLVAPRTRKAETIHVIVEIEDRGAPSLFAYRRAVIQFGVQPLGCLRKKASSRIDTKQNGFMPFPLALVAAARDQEL